jgi:hypothetical protein
MLIQIGENSASLTSFGSLASAGYTADVERIPNAITVGYRPSAFKLALRWIRNLFPAVWGRHPAVKPH